MGHGNQSTQGQAGSSTSAPQESSTDAMLKQILESQTRSEKHIGYKLKNLHTKVDGSYKDLNNKFSNLASHFKALENQFASMPSNSKCPMGSLPEKSEQNPKEYCKVILSTTSSEIELSDHEKKLVDKTEHKTMERVKAQAELKKKPNFQYNNYQQKPFYNNNQQGGYQVRQNYSQGLPSKGNQSIQGQAGSSTSAPQESSTDALLKQILESQTRSEMHIGYELKNLHTKVDGSYNDLNNKFLQLSSHFKAFENQFASMPSTSKRPMGSLPENQSRIPKSIAMLSSLLLLLRLS
ncbi:hypothetical protein F2Q69_00015933 [Brassica cretica]|uniref:Uncharacterized protein n=1 Tax=Brassica cretica TaxID=69181 RepID=A0A8S9R4K1_BRACR|nr:hypothetical protein F2Q69_00015933 [Brassica cretica]